MPREFHRSQRVAQSIHRTLSELLRTEIQDARLADVTITHVDVSRDLAVARVYYTVRDTDHSDADAAFRSAAGFLRRELAHEMRLRTTPELRFVRDDSLERGEAVNRLIDSVIERERGADGAESE